MVIFLFVCFVAVWCSPVAPVLPNHYTLRIHSFISESTYFDGRLLYNWDRREQVSEHYDYCMAGDQDVACRLIMKNNMTFIIQNSTCCRFPDGDVPIPPPDAYTYWTFVGNSTVDGGIEANEWTMEGFKWWVSFESGQQPLRFQFGGGDVINFSPPLIASLPKDFDSRVATPAGCEKNICPFCWFPPSPYCPY